MKVIFLYGNLKSSTQLSQRYNLSNLNDLYKKKKECEKIYVHKNTSSIQILDINL